MSVVENTKEQMLSSGRWSVDPAHSTIEFRVKHMLIQTVKGRFRDFDGSILAGDEPSVSGSIRVASLETMQAERDAHLRSPDFFDAERYPKSTSTPAFGVNTFWTLEELYVVRADGLGRVRRLTRNAAGDRFAAWLPDGRIFFASNRTSLDAWDGGDRADYYVMNSDGGGVRCFAWEPGARASNGSHTSRG